MAKMITTQKMTMRHYDQVAALWAATEDMSPRRDDMRENIRRYLRRNPGLSVVALEGDRVVGAVLCGHDGRRGVLHHLAVAQEYRRKGIGKKIEKAVVANLRQVGIAKAWILILAENDSGRKFWKSMGWKESDMVLFAFKDLL